MRFEIRPTDRPGRCELVETSSGRTIVIAGRPVLQQMIADGTAAIRARMILGVRNDRPTGPRIEVIGGHGRAVHRREMGQGARR